MAMALGQHPSQETVLTPAQQTAVDHPLAPLMIIAGAGTGKTFTLVSRVAHLISHYHISPKTVLALTFSEQAAAELKGRILAMGTAKPSVLCHCRLMVNLCRRGRTLLSSVCRVPSETGPGSPWLSIPASATPVGSTYRSLEQLLDNKSS